MNPMVFVVSPLVGAGIGYITNWIAIKMLFRPLKPVKILGREISALQGVIPKRQGELARSIGETVGEHLLTEDAFEKILNTEETKEKIRQLVRSAVDSLQKEEKTIDQLLQEFMPELANNEELYLQLNNLISRGIVNILRSDQTLDAIQVNLIKLFKESLSGDGGRLLYLKCKSSLRQYLLTNLHNPSVAHQINQFLSTKVQEWQGNEERIGDLIPDELVKSTKRFLTEQGPKISNQIVDYLSSRKTHRQIRERIEGFFKQGFWMHMLGKLFADKDKIADQIVDQLIDFISDQHNQQQLIEKINNVLDGMLDTKICELTSKIDEEAILRGTELLLMKVTTPQFIDTCLDSLEGMFFGEADSELALAQVASTSEFPVVDELGDLTRNLIKDFINQDFIQIWTGKIISSQIDNFRQVQVKSIFVNVQTETISKVENTVLNLVSFIHHNYLNKLMGVVNFEKVVEEKVLSFDLEELESLVLQVMSVELKSITLFGLYLGLLMGFITPLIGLLLG